MKLEKSNLKEKAFVVKYKRAECVILLPDHASSGEIFAAHELKDHIKQITGVELEEVREHSCAIEKGAYISIGRTKLSREYIDDKKIDSLGDSGYSVFCNNGNMFIVGKRWGSMFGVYHFLESLGVRWFSPDCTVVPEKASVKMTSRSFEYKPEFWYRYQYWNNSATPTWLARMRINGNNGQACTLQDDMGGAVITINECHSYKLLVPPEEYFFKKPEWFALKEDGHRGESEYCLTNRELRQFVTQKVLNDLRIYQGKVDNYWVSQNDGHLSGCFCNECTEERRMHGGSERWSANIINFTNYVAGHTLKEFPNVLIKTLAYSYTKIAPENIAVADNVLVEICGNFKQGTDPHAELVKQWSKIARNISAYTYGGSNYGYWWPYPNVWEMGMQCKWALQRGVRAFYIQGTAIGKGSGLVDLRAYLTARLSWDPSRNVKKEIRSFCKAFYGPGSEYIVEYIEWYSKYTRQYKMEVEGGWGVSERWREWVTKDAMIYCDTLFQQALAATKNNPIYDAHVRQAYLEVLWGIVMVHLKEGIDIYDKELSFSPGADTDFVTKRAKLFGEIMRENGYNMKSEDVPFEADKYPH